MTTLMEFAPPQQVILSVVGCSRCGENHEHLEFNLLDRGVDASGFCFTHWSTCPTNGQPILLRVQVTTT